MCISGSPTWGEGLQPLPPILPVLGEGAGGCSALLFPQGGRIGIEIYAAEYELVRSVGMSTPVDGWVKSVRSVG